jgi:Cof subfamily protein (haloacid dehalogenase superfamily)
MSRARSLPFKCSAVISDVDGTLVTDEKILTSRAVSAVAELRANGIIFSITSARPPRGLRELLRALGVTAPVIGFNGGVVASSDLSIITEHLLDSDVARRAVDVFDASGAQVWVFCGQDWLIRDAEGPYVGLEQRTVAFGPTVVDDFGSALDAAAKIVGVSADFGLLERCEREMQSALAEKAFIARSQPYYLDITHPLANKGRALTELAKLIGIPLAEIAVLGDSANDVAMFEQSGLSIAMGNASAEVQRAADFVTDSNRDEGFASAIDRFILRRNRSNERAEVARAEGLA